MPININALCTFGSFIKFIIRSTKFVKTLDQQQSKNNDITLYVNPLMLKS